MNRQFISRTVPVALAAGIACWSIVSACGGGGDDGAGDGATTLKKRPGSGEGNPFALTGEVETDCLNHRAGIGCPLEGTCDSRLYCLVVTDGAACLDEYGHPPADAPRCDAAGGCSAYPGMVAATAAESLVTICVCVTPCYPQYEAGDGVCGRGACTLLQGRNLCLDGGVIPADAAVCGDTAPCPGGFECVKNAQFDPTGYCVETCNLNPCAAGACMRTAAGGLCLQDGLAPANSIACTVEQGCGPGFTCVPQDLANGTGNCVQQCDIDPVTQ